MWTRPGDPNFRELIGDLPTISSGPHSGLNQVGNGSLTLPGDFDTSLLVSDSVKRLCRLMCIDQGSPEVAFEFFPGQAIPSTDADDPDVSVTGIGMNGVLAYARTEPWDWDGSDVFESANPDWIWGGPNALPRLNLSSLQNINAEWDVWTTGSPATVQLEVTTAEGTQTTATFSFNSLPRIIESRLQALSNVTDVTVQGDGTVTDPWRIIFYNPAVASITDVIVSSGTGDQVEVVEGGWSPAPVTRSQFADERIDPAVHGDYGDPPIEVVFSPLDAGADYAVQVNATGQFAGSQILVSVKPGQMYQARIRVHPQVTGRYRLVIRDQYEQLIKWHTPTEVVLTAGSYQELVVPDVLIPQGVTTVIMRVAVVSSNPAEIDTFWVNWQGAELTEGMPKASPGKILQDLYDDATVNHSGRVVWEDEANPGTPYLALDFTDALDSNGDAWDRFDLSFRTPMRMSYSQVMGELARLGYEYRVVPDDVENGSWLWQVYNPGGLGTDRTSDPYPGIIGGTTDVRRQLAAISPSGTDVMVETIDYQTARARDATMVTNLGRVEASVFRREATDPVLAAQEALEAVKRGAKSDQYTFADPGFRPFVDFSTGDLLGLDDPPERPDTSARVIDVAGALGDGEEWTIQFGSAIDLNPDAAVADAVGRLQLADPVHRPQGAFDRRENQLLPQAVSFGGGGGMAHILIVSDTEPPEVQNKADYIVPSADSAADLQTIFDSLPSGSWSIWMAGVFELDDDVTVPDGAWIRGLGYTRVATDL